MRQYTLRFHEKWIEPGSASESPLGSPDIQSLSDIGNAYQVVSKTRLFVFGTRQIVSVWFAGLAPLIPLFAHLDRRTGVQAHRQHGARRVAALVERQLEAGLEVLRRCRRARRDRAGCSRTRRSSRMLSRQVPVDHRRDPPELAAVRSSPTSRSTYEHAQHELPRAETAGEHRALRATRLEERACDVVRVGPRR